MKTWLLFFSTTISFGIAGCATDVKCGDGTTKVGDTCEGDGSGSGNNTTCGAGTHLDGTTCVPDGAPAGGAPSITKMDPASAGISGSGLFTLTGTNFAGSDISDLHVFFGPTTDMNCEAVVGAATPTSIAGEIPAACDLNVTITVTTNKGMATTPFHYDAIFAADGDAGGVMGQAGDLYVIDPYNQRFFDVGQVSDQDGYVYGVNGLAFGNGTLFAVSTGDTAAGDYMDGASSLLSVDLSAGATWIAETKDAANHPFIVTDIKFSGTVLYGLAYAGNATTSRPANKRQFVVTIDPATGVVTKVGTNQPGVVQPDNGGGLAVDSTGAVFTATTAAGSFDTLDMATGAHTSMFTLDYFAAPITSMTYFGTNLLAVIDNGAYGVEINDTVNWSGQTLALIDPTADPSMAYYVNPLFEMPNRATYKAMVHAVVVPPADFSFGGGSTMRLHHADWHQLQAATGTTSHTLQQAR